MQMEVLITDVSALWLLTESEFSFSAVHFFIFGIETAIKREPGLEKQHKILNKNLVLRKGKQILQIEFLVK